MMRRTMVSLLAAACGIVACGSPSMPQQAQAMPAVATEDARPVAKAAATRTPPVLSPAIEQARDRAYRDDLLALADDVAVLGDARALAIAATLRGIGLWREAPGKDAGTVKAPDARIRHWLDESERLAPNDVTALVLSLDMLKTDAARQSALHARWRRLEPDNLVPILHAALPEDALFQAAATATVFDSHYDDAIRAGIDTLSRVSSPALTRLRERSPELGPDGHDVTVVIGFVVASALPAFQNVSAPCRAQSLSDLRLQQCDRIARTLAQHSDIMIAEMIGIAMIGRLSTADAEDRSTAEAMDREKDWLIHHSGALSQRELRAYMTRFAVALRETPQIGERELMRKVLQASGVPTVPPADWRPARASVSTGAGR